MSIPLNGEPPLGYRIGTSNRVLNAATLDPTGFLVLNQTNNSVFQAEGGVWASGTFDADLLAAWFATTVGVGGPGVGYRIGTSDRTIGGTTGAADGFLVLNSTNGNVFEAEGGLWTVGGTFPPALIDAWQAA